MNAASTTAVLTLVTALASAVSAVASAISAYKSYHSITTQRHINATVSVGAAAAELAASLDDPKVLLLHGVTEEDLQRDHLTPAELSYIVRSFTMGETYYRIHEYNKKRIQLSQYRRSFLSSPTVQTAWRKYVRGRFVSNKPYTEAIDDYLEKLPVAPATVGANG